MIYEPYISLSREALLRVIAEQMSEKRFRHVLGVERIALELADRYACDPVKASLAALLHDYAKEQPDSVFLDLIDRYQLNPTLKTWGNNVWHGLVGRYLITEQFGLTDEEILTAIARHTVGASDMTLLDKVIYVADYIEPGRDFPGVETARQLAAEDLDKAVAYETARTIEHLTYKGLPIYPQTLETYNAYVRYL
ncbi:bis(5'-nucleosyl)-tetraphosphatase (symmetrical) YqeK [Streptococcus sp. E29BA]|uniref:bis(5'-nucleosyl)-tetraphosphatase (symmetrical) YqeK n=1 Tax=Streptococcus sp. E29BA TaxID=3278716 RepID=UPI00359ECDEA